MSDETVKKLMEDALNATTESPKVEQPKPETVTIESDPDLSQLSPEQAEKWETLKESANQRTEELTKLFKPFVDALTVDPSIEFHVVAIDLSKNASFAASGEASIEAAFVLMQIHADNLVKAAQYELDTEGQMLGKAELLHAYMLFKSLSMLIEKAGIHFGFGKIAPVTDIQHG